MLDEVAKKVDSKKLTRFGIYKNKDSKLNESILIHYTPEKGTYSLHIYAIVISDIYSGRQNNVLDTRKHQISNFKTPLKAVGQVPNGSLSLIRYFVRNPAEKKYEEKMREKYPKKKMIRNKPFPPLILLIAHYCDQFTLAQDLDEEELVEQITAISNNFDEIIQEDIHQTLRTLGKPHYLKGQRILETFHQTREFPEAYLKKLVEDKMLIPISKQRSLGVLVPVVKGTRRDSTDQKPLFQRHPDSNAISQIINTKSHFLSLTEQRFPLVIIGEPEARRNLVLNILKNANAKFLILDPKENYGRLAQVNARIRGYLLGANYYLNLISTEGETIREQVYAYWFAKIIANIANLRSDIAKTIETYLLGAYRDPSNQTKPVFQFKDFANQELTSEVTKMGRSESATITNVLYPLGTYEEISLITKVGRSLSFETIFDTKGTIIQFTRNDDQLTKIAYLFTLLKLRSITNDHPKILVLENIDDIIGSTKYNQDNDLTDLILGLAEDYHLIFSARSPSKIQELFKNTNAKFINRLLMPNDKKLLFNEYKIAKTESASISKLTDKEFMILVQDFSTPNYLKIDAELNTKMKIQVDELEQESNRRVIRSKDYLQNEGIAPEVRKAIFELIKILREKPNKIIPEEGIEQILSECSATDVLRAKEIARDEAFIKIIESSPRDSTEKISLLKLTERGEDYYRSYLNLKKQIPLISITSRVVEKNFEKDILERLGKADKFFEVGDYNSSINIMLEVAVRMLGVLPEEDRFKKGKVAAKILEQWSYLSSLKEHGNVSNAKRLFQDFSQMVANGMKFIKHQLVESEFEPDQEQVTSPKRKAIDGKSLAISEEKHTEDDFEIDFDLEQGSKTNHQIDPWEKQIEVIDTKGTIDTQTSDNSASLFKDAAADLRTAGMSHIDSNGELFKPEKGNIFDEDFFEQEKDLEILNYNPFEPEKKKAKSKPKKNPNKKELAKLDSLKQKLMEAIAKHLEVSVIDDEKFMWHCLETRFNGKLDDGYTISEIISTMKILYQDAEKQAMISDKTIKKLEKLINNHKLLPDNLIVDLRQYVNDI